MSNTADQGHLNAPSEAGMTARDAAATEAVAGAAGDVAETNDSGGKQARRDSTAFVRVRRAPRYLPFMITGGMLGLAVAALLTALSRSLTDPLAAATLGVGRNYSATQVLLYLGLGLVAIGAMLGAGVALLLERRRR